MEVSDINLEMPDRDNRAVRVEVARSNPSIHENARCRMARRDKSEDVKSQAKQAEEHAKKQQEDLKRNDERAYETHGKHARKAVFEAWKDKGWTPPSSGGGPHIARGR